MTGHTG